MHLPHPPTSFLTLYLILCFLAAAANTDSDCPEGCVCKWKSGKETTECPRLNLTSVPSGIAAGTQVLDLGQNPGLGALENDLFLGLGITNLQRLRLPGCGIAEVAPRYVFYLLYSK